MNEAQTRRRRTPAGPNDGRRVRVVAAALMLLATCLVLARPATAQEVPELEITSTAYIVIDADTGEVFAQRNAHEEAAIASLTKIFTAIEAIELGAPSTTITTSDADEVSSEATQMGFGPGETFTLEDLIYGMLLPSGNDAARAIARSLGAQPGDTDQEALDHFVALTNQRIQNMGLTETHLVNPDGWGVPNHYSSAHDLAVFTMYALKYPRFVQAISTETYETSNGDYHLTNTNKMLDTYEGIIGGKTGYDLDAGYCLVEVAQRNGSTMISVTLNGVAPDDWYDDNRALLDYAFKQKAARQATGVGIVGEVVSYKDPDAAVIAQVATAGGSLGQSAPVAVPTITGGLGLVGPAVGGGGVPPTAAVALVEPDRGYNPQWLAALAVAAAIILGRTVSAYWHAPRPVRAAVASPPVMATAASSRVALDPPHPGAATTAAETSPSS